MTDEPAPSTRRVLDALPDALLIVSADGVILAANRGVHRQFGLDPAGLAGMRLVDAVADPPETVARYLRDCGRSDATVPGLLHVGRGGGRAVAARAEGSLVVPRAEGTEAQVLLRLTPREAAPSGFAVLNQKIDELSREIVKRRRVETALRRSDERLLLTLDASQLGTFYCDLPFDRLIWNVRCKEHFGLPPDAEVTLGLFYERIHPDDRAATRAAIDRAIAGPSDFEAEYRTVDPEGRVRWIVAKGRAFYDEHGAPKRFDGITIDITDRKRDEAELREAKAVAEAASRAKDDFLAALSHELRTPLTPILAAVSAVEAWGDLPADRAADLDAIRRNVELEARLIDDLLDLTKVSQGLIALDRAVVDVHDCLREALDVCRGDIGDKRHEVTLDLSASLSHVAADPVRLRQVFWNLIANAVKYTPEGGKIGLRTANDAARRLVVEVSDTGVGIDPEAMPRLFSAFEQAERTVTRGHGGLGLGLAISKALVEMHGGRLAAESAGKDRGATFTVHLDTIALPVTPAVPDPGTMPVETLRILLVEDHVDTLRIISRLFRRRGYHVETADSVQAALERAEREDFDLLISDIGLPDGTGHDVIRHLQARRRVKGIALSGFGRDEDLERSRDAGFAVHLTKPIDFQRLETLVRELAR